MHWGNFARLLLVVLASAGFQLMTCAPADSSASASVNTEGTRENSLAKNALPIVQQFAKTHKEYPGTYLDDTEIPDRMYSNSLRKRIFYSEKGRLADNYIPENHRSVSLQTKRMDEKRPHPAPLRGELQASDAAKKLKTLMSLRDRAKAFHEEIDDSIRKQEALIKSHKEQLQKDHEWDRIFQGFSVD